MAFISKLKNITSAIGNSQLVQYFRDDGQGIEDELSASAARLDAFSLRQDVLENAQNGMPALAASAEADRTAAEVAAAAADADRLATLAALTQAIAANPDLNTAVKMNPSSIDTDLAIPAGFNAYSAGSITISEDVNVTIADGASWTIN